MITFPKSYIDNIVLLAYITFTALKLYHKLKSATLFSDNIYENGHYINNPYSNYAIGIVYHKVLNFQRLNKCLL